MLNLKLPEGIRTDVEYLQDNIIHGRNARKISKNKAVQIAIRVYTHFLKEKKEK